ncbi:MAG: hypothetical protein K1X53_08435 [Candidatus Sumerlaeaceae bacterium]|nr:hypothetical protein [Candidatus Sumerlaeaceae bacterium]
MTITSPLPGNAGESIHEILGEAIACAASQYRHLLRAFEDHPVQSADLPSLRTRLADTSAAVQALTHLFRLHQVDTALRRKMQIQPRRPRGRPRKQPQTSAPIAQTTPEIEK